MQIRDSIAKQSAVIVPYVRIFFPLYDNEDGRNIIQQKKIIVLLCSRVIYVRDF